MPVGISLNYRPDLRAGSEAARNREVVNKCSGVNRGGNWSRHKNCINTQINQQVTEFFGSVPRQSQNDLEFLPGSILHFYERPNGAGKRSKGEILIRNSWI
ncbi:MAG: hypothetical protein VB140_10470 [Burkholderia sp.]